MLVGPLPFAINGIARARILLACGIYIAADFVRCKNHLRIHIQLHSQDLRIRTRLAMTIVRVAACHAAPIFLNARRTADKAVNLITEAAK